MFRLSARQRLFKLIVPAAMPKFFAGLRISVSLSLVLMVVDGRQVTDREFTETYRLTFDGGRYAIRVAGRTQTRGAYKLDQDSTPRAIDITPADGDDAGRTQLSIYRLEGDTLTVAVHDRVRPTRFDAATGQAGLLMVLRRERP